MRAKDVNAGTFKTGSNSIVASDTHNEFITASDDSKKEPAMGNDAEDNAPVILGVLNNGWILPDPNDLLFRKVDSLTGKRAMTDLDMAA